MFEGESAVQWGVVDASQPLRKPRWEAFALARAAGNSGAESYRLAGYAEDPCGANGSRLTCNDQIIARTDWLKAQTATAGVMTAIEKRQMLAAIVRDSQARESDRIAAIREDNNMAGDGGGQGMTITITKAWS